jgi:hypothetical protein
MSGRMNGRNYRRGSLGASVDPFNDRFPDDAATFDDLTNLFLGDLAPSTPTAAPGRDAESQASPDSTSPLSPALRASSVVPDLDRSAPQRAGQSLPAAPSPRDAQNPPVEVLVLGHLPALGAIWGTQYLRDLARQCDTPVASFRLQAGFVSVELFDFGPGGVTKPAMGVKTLEDAVNAAAAVAGRWVLRSDGDDELELIDGRLIQTVTLLTGADEAATIGAYRTIKRLAQRLEALEPTPSPRLHVVVMGTNPEQTQRVGEKLASTANACLGREVSFQTAAARIGAVRPATLFFNGKSNARPAEVLSMLDAAFRARPAATPVSSTRARPVAPPSPSITSTAWSPATAAPTSSAGTQDLSHDLLDEAAASLAATLPAAFIAEPPAPPARIAHTAPSKPFAPTPTAAAKPARITERKPAASIAAPVAASIAAPLPAQPSVSPASTPRPASSPLATHVDGLTHFDAQCPYARGVELAADQLGRLHVLARFDQDHVDETSLGVLLIAAEWAKAHAALLKAAAPALCIPASPSSPTSASASSTSHVSPTIDTAALPIKHVFTDQPRKVRRLLETDVRVHLLSPVRVAGHDGWFCTPLN